MIDTIRIYREIDADVIDILRPFFIVDNDKEGYLVAAEIKDRMRVTPNDTALFILVDEDNKLQGFLIGWVQHTRDSAWLGQAWSDPNVPKHYITEVFDIFSHWVRSHGYNKIYTETARSPKVLKRIYGFEHCSFIMVKEI